MIKESNAQLINENPHDKLRSSAWDESFHTYAVSYLFNRRKSRLSTWMRIITFLGILIPLTVGAYVIDFGAENEIFKKVLSYILAPIALLQLILSTWAIVDRWNEKAEYYGESAFANSQLSEEFKKLGEHPPPELDKLNGMYDKLRLIQTLRDQQDNKYPLNEKERRRGMRWSLRKYKRQCVGCNLIPTSMKSTKCDICGKF